MSKYVKHQNLNDEYFFHEGCFITETSNSRDDDQASIVRARVEPGQQTKWHWLENTFERYAIIAGHGEVEVGDETPREVTTGDVVIIPPGIKQRIRNTSETDLIFYAVCTPPFHPDNYNSED